ncbi:hypothetical protein [Aggregatilinea lenta]|uniref:hypothetical protein n=1 Tax=Aggregatilinea lenta TaxID=913108 RepID=UPI0013C2F017|nr:hypothetical protein [Aggregatilinea lenta]
MNNMHFEQPGSYVNVAVKVIGTFCMLSLALIGVSVRNYGDSFLVLAVILATVTTIFSSITSALHQRGKVTKKSEVGDTENAVQFIEANLVGIKDLYASSSARIEHTKERTITADARRIYTTRLRLKDEHSKATTSDNNGMNVEVEEHTADHVDDKILRLDPTFRRVYHVELDSNRYGRTGASPDQQDQWELVAWNEHQERQHSSRRHVMKRSVVDNNIPLWVIAIFVIFILLVVFTMIISIATILYLL